MSAHKTIRRRLPAGIFSILALLALVAGPAAADGGGGEEIEAFRAELDGFIATFEGRDGFDEAAAAAARKELAGLPPDVVADLREQFESAPPWRELEQVFTLLDRAEADYRSSQREAAERAAPASADAELEVFRSELLFLIARFRAFAPLIGAPDYDRGLAEAERMIYDFPAERLPELRAFYYERAPGWKARLRAPRATSGAAAAALGDKAFSDCEPTFSFNCSATDIDCWFSAIETAITSAANAVSCYASEVGNLVTDFLNQIGGFFSSLPGVLQDIGDFFLGIWDSIESALSDLWNAFLDAVPTTPEDVLALLGLDVITTLHTDPAKLDKDAESFWLTFADGFVQGFTLSVDCDLIGLTIGQDLAIFGVVGTPRAEWICKRGLDWLTEFIWEFVPDDTASLTGKLIYGTLVHYPIKFFCRCLEAQSTVCFDNSQNDHRTLVDALLDQSLSTRATGTGMEALRAQLDTLRNTEIGGVQASVDAAGPDLTALAAAVTALQAEVDSLASGQGGQVNLIDDFQALALRLDIEENLMLSDPTQATAVFQMPQAFGGELETVRQVVEQAIVLTTAAGLDTFDAVLALALADAQFGEGAWEKAYENYRLAYRETVRAGE